MSNQNEPIDWNDFDEYQESPAPPYYVEASMLYNLATDDNARRMVELLTERGYHVAYGSGRMNSRASKDHVPQAVWDECLDIIAAEQEES